MRALISHFFNYKPDEVELLPMSEYRGLLEQAINLSNITLGGKLELETEEDKQKAAKKKIEETRPDLL